MKILQTSRLLLREFTPEDADALALVLSDPETMRFYPAPYDRSGVEQWIERNRQRYRDDGVGLWAMLLKPTPLKSNSGDAKIPDLTASGSAASTRAGAPAPHELIGDCGIIRQPVEGELLYEIGYHLRRDLWGQGLATEAAIACRDWAFAHLKTDRLISLIRPENLPSRRVAERNGMTVWKEVSWRGLPHCVYSIERAQSAP
jgi:RimJ/RimL family protein N-acetyltransferase